MRWNPDRDGRILLALGRMLLLTAIQVQQVAPFGSREAAARRLRKLAKLGLVRIYRPKDKAEPHRYGLTLAGKKLLLTLDEEIRASDLHIAKGIRRADLDHLTKLSEIRVKLLLATEKRNDVFLAEYRGEADVRRLHRPGATTWVPDGFFVLEADGDPGRCLGFWLELDNGSEAIQSLCRTKFADLAEHADEGGAVLEMPAWVVLLLVESRRRITTLMRNLQIFGSDIFFIGELEKYLADPLAQIWRPVPKGKRSDPLRAVSRSCSLVDLLFQRGVPTVGTGKKGNTPVNTARLEPRQTPSFGVVNPERKMKRGAGNFKARSQS